MMKTKDAQTMRAVERVLTAALRAVTKDAPEQWTPEVREAIRGVRAAAAKFDEALKAEVPYGKPGYVQSIKRIDTAQYNLKQAGKKADKVMAAAGFSYKTRAENIARVINSVTRGAQWREQWRASGKRLQDASTRDAPDFSRRAAIRAEWAKAGIDKPSHVNKNWIRNHWEQALQEMPYALIGGTLEYLLTPADQKILTRLYKAGRHRKKILDLLEDLNYHTLGRQLAALK